MSDKIFDKLVIINQFLVIDLGPAFQFHFLLIVLPLNLNVDKSMADEFKHLLWVTLKLHAHMERPWLLLLEDQYLLVSVRCKWILGVVMSLKILILLIVKPLGVSLVLKLGHLLLIVSLESLMDLVEPLEMSIAHG